LLQDNNLTNTQKDFVLKHVAIDSEKVFEIEQSTLGQSENSVWFHEQKKRLTASNFGLVINRRITIFPKSILSRIFSKNLLTASKACK